MNLPNDPAAAAHVVWTLSLVLGLVVAVVVAVLLSLVHYEAGKIHQRVDSILTRSQLIVHNTSPIVLLYHTSDVTGRILAAAVRIKAAAGAIENFFVAHPSWPSPPSK